MVHNQVHEILQLVIGIYQKLNESMALPTSAKIGIGWSIATVLGIYAFVLSKESVNARRYEIMKARQRLRDTNIVD